MDKRTRTVITVFLGVLLLVTLTILLIIFLVIIPAHDKYKVPNFSGLTIYPKLNGSGTLQFNTGQGAKLDALVYSIDSFLKKYYAPEEGVSYSQCYYNYLPSDGAVCKFGLDQLGDCNADNNKYGYVIGRPCVIIQLNPDVGWEPNNYAIPGQLPEGLSSDVVELLEDYAANLPDASSTPITPVILSCDGMTEEDKKQLGKVSYFPKTGFPGYFYPKKHVKGYVLPTVAVRFDELPKGVAVSIQCKVFAKNISSNWGYANFRIQVD